MVKTLLKDYNNTPEYKKSNLTNILTKVSEVKINNITPEKNALEKSKDLIDRVVSLNFFC